MIICYFLQYLFACSLQLSEAMVKAQKEIEDINLQLLECQTRLVFLKNKSDWVGFTFNLRNKNAIHEPK